MNLALGIDGGGSKTAWLLAPSIGEPRWPARSGPTSLTRASAEVVAAALDAGTAAVLAAAGVSAAAVTAVTGGFAGAANPAAAASLQAMLRSFFPQADVQVTTDLEIAWMAAAEGAPAIVVVAGTGSAAFGRVAGRSARAGGAGPAIGDPGSGDWIARLAGRNAAAVIAAAAAGEAAARDVLQRAGLALATLAVEVAATLQAGPPVFFTGGVFQHSAIVRAAFRSELHRLLPAVSVAPSPRPPVEGALAMARARLLR